MKAIAMAFPDTPLGELRATEPALLPRWLLERDVEVPIFEPRICFVLAAWLVQVQRELLRALS